MKISLVIPVYNEEAYIEDCLHSVSKLQVTPYEVVVVDNNCTDRTVEIVKRFPFVTVIREKKQGMIAARNAGFNAATGNIIARCDADTHVPKLWTKRILWNFTKYSIDALTGPISYYDAPLKTTMLARAYLDMMSPIHRGGETLIGPNMIISRAIWERVRSKVCLNDKLVHEDIDLAYHIQEVGGIIRRDNRLVVDTSSRRIKRNPYSFFSEYPARFMKTLMYHDKAIVQLKKKFRLPAWYTKRKFHLK